MVETVTRYRVEVERGKKYWTIYVPAVERWTQARKVGEIREMAQDLIELMTETQPADIELDVHIALPADVQERLDRVEELRAQAAQAQGKAADELRGAARMLHDTGLSMREIGEVLGVSYQRAHQLVSGRRQPA
jgi:DNA-directed RNA polymerase specialized sigma24 family protein